jgi:penicillin-binding protein 1A
VLPQYGLRQVPDVSGGFTAMDPKTGRVFALVGGWDFHDSQFDRATQAKRQPGSSIKPFVYVTALEGDYTPSSIVEDAPISLPRAPACRCGARSITRAPRSGRARCARRWSIRATW